MPAPFRLGFLSHLHGPQEPGRLYRDYVELFVAAEDLGFDSAWVAQHHFDASAGRPAVPVHLPGRRGRADPADPAGHRRW